MNHRRLIVTLLMAALITSFAGSCQKGEGGEVVSSKADLWAHWNYLYQVQLADYLKSTGKYKAASEALDSATVTVLSGLWPDLEYVGEEIDSVKGRALFIYTDGLNEAENPQQEQFGDERLLNILRNTHFDTARQVIETLAAVVDKHRSGAEPNDDLTMMCLSVS